MGFFKDVGELRAAIRTNVANGRGSRSLVEAVEQVAQRPAEPARVRKRSLKRTFFLSALFGAIWESTRRRR